MITLSQTETRECWEGELYLSKYSTTGASMLGLPTILIVAAFLALFFVQSLLRRSPFGAYA